MKPISIKKRKRKDIFLNACTYASSGVSLFLLLAIMIFIFRQGYSSLNSKLLTNDYWSENYIIEVDKNNNRPETYPFPEGEDESLKFSSKWGIGFMDHLDANQDKKVLVAYVDENSPFNQVIDQSKKTEMDVPIGYQVEKIDYKKIDGTSGMSGALLSQSAQEVAQSIDEEADSITSMYMQSAGGGIKGSIQTTLYLILISLICAIPIGIAAAIYLKEYAKPTKINKIITSAIETLSGVPSIIFGLMGVTVLYPITTFFGATTTSILLGSLTMAIILLPTIIRSSEEALLNVPQGLKDASLSLGANESQTIFKVILPSCFSGILSGVLLSVGRIIGESAALIYTMGSFVNDSPTLTSQGTSLAVHIWSIMSGEQPNFELASAISIVIMVIVCILHLSVSIISKRLQKV